MPDLVAFLNGALVAITGQAPGKLTLFRGGNTLQLQSTRCAGLVGQQGPNII